VELSELILLNKQYAPTCTWTSSICSSSLFHCAFAIHAIQHLFFPCRQKAAVQKNIIWRCFHGNSCTAGLSTSVAK